MYLSNFVYPKLSQGPDNCMKFLPEKWQVLSAKERNDMQDWQLSLGKIKPEKAVAWLVWAEPALPCTDQHML